MSGGCSWSGVEKPGFSRSTCLKPSLGFFVFWFTSVAFVTMWLRLAVSPNLSPLWASIFYWESKVSDALPSFLVGDLRALRDHAEFMALDLGVSMVGQGDEPLYPLLDPKFSLPSVGVLCWKSGPLLWMRHIVSWHEPAMVRA